MFKCRDNHCFSAWQRTERGEKKGTWLAYEEYCGLWPCIFGGGPVAHGEECEILFLWLTMQKSTLWNSHFSVSTKCVLNEVGLFRTYGHIQFAAHNRFNIASLYQCCVCILHICARCTLRAPMLSVCCASLPNAPQNWCANIIFQSRLTRWGYYMLIMRRKCRKIFNSFFHLDFTLSSVFVSSVVFSYSRLRAAWHIIYYFHQRAHI